jgi:hypothetical protein
MERDGYWACEGSQEASNPSRARHEVGTMTIDIDRLTETELIDLNNRIVARLRFLQQMRSHAEMLEFRIGDRVESNPKGSRPSSVC